MRAPHPGWLQTVKWILVVLTGVTGLLLVIGALAAPGLSAAERFFPVLFAAVLPVLLALSLRKDRRAARHAEQSRTDEDLEALEMQVLHLAASYQGVLTATQVAKGLGWTMPVADDVLARMEDGVRVTSHLNPAGITLYTFHEVIHDLRVTYRLLPEDDAAGWVEDPNRPL